jgi:hypothetical protein
MPDFIMESGMFIYCPSIRGELFRNSRSLAAQFSLNSAAKLFEATRGAGILLQILLAVDDVKAFL